MSRDFTLKEKILLLVLSILLVGLAYYYLVDEPVRTSLANAAAKEAEYQTSLDLLQTQLVRLNSMKKEIDSVMSSGTVSRMESYNNVKEEIQLLNDILKDSKEYDITFADVSQDGNQIRRNVMLRFTTKNYKTAKKIMNELANSRYRCLISDIEVSSLNNNLKRNTISIALTVTFYETMVGGTPDAGLPEKVDVTEGEDLRTEFTDYDYLLK